MASHATPLGQMEQIKLAVSNVAACQASPDDPAWLLSLVGCHDEASIASFVSTNTHYLHAPAHSNLQNAFALVHCSHALQVGQDVLQSASAPWCVANALAPWCVANALAPWCIAKRPVLQNAIAIVHMIFRPPMIFRPDQYVLQRGVSSRAVWVHLESSCFVCRWILLLPVSHTDMCPHKIAALIPLLSHNTGIILITSWNNHIPFLGKEAHLFKGP